MNFLEQSLNMLQETALTAGQGALNKYLDGRGYSVRDGKPADEITPVERQESEDANEVREDSVNGLWGRYGVIPSRSGLSLATQSYIIGGSILFGIGFLAFKLAGRR